MDLTLIKTEQFFLYKCIVYYYGTFQLPTVSKLADAILKNNMCGR